MVIPNFKALPLLIAGLGLTVSGTIEAAELNKTAPIGNGVQEQLKVVEVKGAADSYDPRRDDTAARIVIGTDELTKFGDGGVADVLKRVPGITVIGGRDVRMRGLGNGYTAILLNGDRPPAGFSIDSVPPSTIERIEVMRSSSAEFSAQGIAGTINIVLKRAIRSGRHEMKVSGIKGAAVSGGNTSVLKSEKGDGYSYSVTATASQNNVKTELSSIDTRVAGQRSTSERRSTAADSGQSRTLSLSPRFIYSVDSDNQLSWQGYLNLLRADVGGNVVTQASYGPLPMYASVVNSNHVRTSTGTTDLSWTYKLAPGVSLELKGSASRGTDTGSVVQQGFDTGGLALRRQIATEAADRGHGASMRWLSQSFEHHALSAGLEWSEASRSDERDQKDRAISGNSSASLEKFTARTHRAALFIQDEWTVNSAWSLSAGMRSEISRQIESGEIASAVRHRDVFWSPSIQSLWKLPGGDDQLRMAVHRTYKAPTLSMLIPRLYASINNSEYAPDIRGNPALRAERARGFDGAFEHYWKTGAMFSISGAMRQIKGAVGRELRYMDGRWLETRANLGDARVKSVDLEFKLPLKTLSPELSGVDARASYSRNWSTVSSIPPPHNRLDQQIPYSTNLGVDYKAAGGNITIGASFALRGATSARLSPIWTSTMNRHRDLDAYALWRISPQANLRLTLRNLTTDVEVSGRYFRSSESVSSVSSVPTERSVRLGLELKL